MIICHVTFGISPPDEFIVF